jgi:hypothetical protein
LVGDFANNDVANVDRCARSNCNDTRQISAKLLSSKRNLSLHSYLPPYTCMLHPSFLTSAIFQWFENTDKLIQIRNFLNHKKHPQFISKLYPAQCSQAPSDFHEENYTKDPHSESWRCSVFSCQHEWNNTPTHLTASYIIAHCIALFTGVATISSVTLPSIWRLT